MPPNIWKWIDPLGLACKTRRRKNGQFAKKPGRKSKSKITSHGNTKTSKTQAVLYGKFDKNGNFLKWGKSQKPQKRYTKKKLDGGDIQEYRRDSTDKILKRERKLTERFPGPENREP